MASTLIITPATARKLAMMAQRLGGPRPAKGPAGLHEVLSALRCLQLDPISVVARSHQIVLWSRLGGYHLQDLDDLLWQERALFEYWAHCASIVLTEDYPIHARRMAAYRSEDPQVSRYVGWLAENAELRDHILAELAAKGPLSSSHFEDRSQTQWYSSGWTSGRTVSQMLQTLWHQGLIGVAGRKGMTRLWDLMPRIIPAAQSLPELDDPAIDRLAASHALRSLGIARGNQITHSFIRGWYRDLPATLRALETTGEIARVAIADAAGEWPGVWYVPTASLEIIARIDDLWQPRTTLLSPFDNLICDRARTLQLFGFDYRVEIYVPEAKRKYGYYALPILHGDHLIGRIDAMNDRKEKRLIVRRAFIEPQLEPQLESPRKISAATKRAIARALNDLASFVGAATVTYADGVAAFA